MKKILAICMAALLLLTALPISMVLAEDAENAIQIIGSVSQETVCPGQEFTLTLSIGKNPGLTGWSANATYDEAAFEVTKIEAGPLFPASGMSYSKIAENSPVSATFVDGLASENYFGDGVLYTATIKVKDDAAVGTYLFDVDCFNHDTSNFMDIDWNEFEVNFVDVSITVGAHDCTYEETKTPTCDEPGEKKGTCSICGNEVIEEIPALGHDYKDVVTDPSCEAEGYTTHTCANCGDSYVDSKVDALGHDYKAVVTDPTCDAAGYTTYTCSRCGDSYKADEVAALGHTPGAEADCENAQTCTVCGAVVNDALGHAYESVETKAPTCTEAGEKTNTCSRCGDITTEAIDALGHTAGAAADCLNAQTCTVCGAEMTAALGHDYKAVVTDPTCEAAGYTTYTCSRCGDSYKADEVAALGHDYKGVVTDPTCEAAGYTTYTCSRCGDSYQADEVAALGHDYTSVVTDPTCVDKGYTTHTCSRCGDVKVDSYVDALGHDYKSEVTIAPTCVAEGLMTYSCSACDDYYVEVIAALGHDNESVISKEPTCGAAGEQIDTCKVCGNVVTSEVPATGDHTYDNDEDKDCNACGDIREITTTTTTTTTTKGEETTTTKGEETTTTKGDETTTTKGEETTTTAKGDDNQSTTKPMGENVAVVMVSGLIALIAAAAVVLFSKKKA